MNLDSKNRIFHIVKLLWFKIIISLAQKIMPLFSFLMKAEYKPIKAVDVARSIVNESKKIITGNKIGIIWGMEFIISWKKIRNGRFLLIISSINWTLFARQNTEIININISNELFNSCLKMYLSTKFIEFFLKYNIHYL